MAELAPGLFVSVLVPPGTAYNIDATIMGGSGIAGGTRALAVSERDWSRIGGAERERLLDEWTRRSAEEGLTQLERWLCSELNHSPERRTDG